MTQAPSECQSAESPGFPELKEQTLRSFRERFQREPQILVAAPGRVNLIGEHIDYNDGFVMPMAIERYVVIAASPKADATDSMSSVHSIDLNETIEIPTNPSTGPSIDGWGRYLEGVISGFVQRGESIPAFDAVVASNVPHGGGLSSSAALEVATATLLEELTNTRLTLLDKSLLCQKAEHDFAGVPCGIMDQFSSAFGQAGQLMLIDCQSEQCTMVPFDSPDISMLITNSNVKHELTGGEYASRRQDCDSGLAKIGKSSWRNVSMEDVQSKHDALTETEFVRARHVVSEIKRTEMAADSLRNSDWDFLGELMYASHASLRDDFDVSCSELDVLVEIAKEIGQEGGVIGSRMTGGGFGGCTVTLVRNTELPSVIQTLERRYHDRTGLTCSCFSSRPARGAHTLESTS